MNKPLPYIFRKQNYTLSFHALEKHLIKESVGYYSDSMEFEVTNDEYEEYLEECKLMNIVPIRPLCKCDNGYFFQVRYNTIKTEV